MDQEAWDSELKQAAQDDLSRKEGIPQPGDIYRHYKGGFYTVIGVSIHESDLTELVTYRSNLKKTFWTRTLAVFAEKVGTPRGMVSRFERIYE